MTGLGEAESLLDLEHFPPPASQDEPSGRSIRLDVSSQLCNGGHGVRHGGLHGDKLGLDSAQDLDLDGIEDVLGGPVGSVAPQTAQPEQIPGNDRLGGQGGQERACLSCTFL